MSDWLINAAKSGAFTSNGYSSMMPTQAIANNQIEVYKRDKEAQITYGDRPFGRMGNSGTTMYYPLKDTLFGADRPQIRFSCIRVNYEEETTAIRNRHSCYFPCPANIAFGDAANLSSIDLGVLGAAASTLSADNLGINQGALEVAGDASIEAMKKAALKGLGGAFGDSFNKGAAVAKIAENPFTNTTYQGANVRTFTFNFKMIAESKEESKMIKDINHFFRVNMYGGTEEGSDQQIDAFLQYPPVWEIDFLSGLGEQGATMNPYLPKLFSCYLGGFNSTFNTTAAAWHEDGAPLEVDISLTFQETRALTQADIYNLNSISGNYYGSEVENMRKRGIGVGGKANIATLASIENFKAGEAPSIDPSETVDLGDALNIDALSGQFVQPGVLNFGQNTIPESVSFSIGALNNSGGNRAGSSGTTKNPY